MCSYEIGRLIYLESIVLWCKERARRITRDRQSLALSLNLNRRLVHDLLYKRCAHFDILLDTSCVLWLSGCQIPLQLSSGI